MSENIKLSQAWTFPDYATSIRIKFIIFTIYFNSYLEFGKYFVSYVSEVS